MNNFYLFVIKLEQLARINFTVLPRVYSGTSLRGHPSSLYDGHLLNPKYNLIMYNKPLTRGHPLCLLVPMVSALERFHCIT